MKIFKVLILITILFHNNLIAQAIKSWSWAHLIGGTNIDISQSFTNDKNGNVYITGRFSETVDFDPSANNSSLTSFGFRDIFLLKIDSLGNFIWVKQIGSVFDEVGLSVFCDLSDNIIIAGGFNGTLDFDPGISIYNITSTAGSTDVFICKLNSNGDFIWAKSFGATEGDEPYSLKTDLQNNIYCSGIFRQTIDFDPSNNVDSHTSFGMKDAFVIKLDSLGNLKWAKTIGGIYDEESGSLDITDNGDVLFSASYYSPIIYLDTITLANNDVSGNTCDFFVVKISNSGSYLWSQTFGSNNGLDYSFAVKNSNNSTVIIGASFETNISFTNAFGTNTYQSNGSKDALIFKLDSLGSFLWGKSFGDNGNDDCFSITTDLNNNIYACGSFFGNVNFNSINSFILNSSGNADTYLLKLDTQGSFIDAKSLGGASGDIAHFVSHDNLNNICITGYSYSPILNLDSIALQNNGLSDFFIAKINCFSTSFINEVSCNSYSSPSGKYTWYNSGVYYDTIPNIYGCDSVITIDLMIKNNTFSNLDISDCVSYITPSGNDTIETTGVYIDTLENAMGCDSIITISFTNNSSSSINIVNACNSYLSPSGNYTWFNSGIYTDTITNSLGCDSVITVNLLLNFPSNSVLNEAVCDIFISPSGQVWNNSGLYHDTILNSNLCDSIIEINLTVANSFNVNINETSCNSYASPSGLYNWNVSGLYNDTLSSVSGCDSILSITLTIIEIDTSVIRSGYTLISNSQNANYQWIYCDSVALPNETNQVFEVEKNGCYALVINNDLCIDTSSCYCFTNLGLNNFLLNKNIDLSPNPAHDKITVKFNDLAKSSATIILLNSIGSIVYEKSYTINNQYVTIDLEEMIFGLYTMLIINDEAIWAEKIVID